MVIQGTQVPMYTKTHTVFVFFWFFNFFFNFMWKTNKIEKEKKTNKNMLNKAKHKSRLTQSKNKTNNLCKHKNTKGEKKVIELLGALFLSHLGRTFPLIKLLNRQWGGRIETVQVRKEHEGFEKISKASKRGFTRILTSRCYHAIALLSG